MSGEWGVALAEIELPEFELPRQLAGDPGGDVLSPDRRSVYAAMSKRGLDAVIVYADREHFANMSYLTGFDPRWEEALLILVPGRTPTTGRGQRERRVGPGRAVSRSTSSGYRSSA